MRTDFVKEALRIGVEAFFPRRCCACNRFFRYSANNTFAAPCAPSDGWTGGLAAHLAQFVCPECSRLFRPVASPVCSSCGVPFASTHGPDHTCPECRRRPPDFRAARSVGLYEGPLQKVIHHFKYKGRDGLSEPLGRLLWEALPGLGEPGSFDRVVPVPLHEKRERQRGFNQAYLLVRRWPRLAARQAVPFEPDRIANGVLVRHADTPPQTGLTKAQRKVNLRHAFKLVDPRAVEGKRILLVDDVMTTGATVGACARVLLQGGANDVRVLTVGRAIH